MELDQRLRVKARIMFLCCGQGPFNRAIYFSACANKLPFLDRQAGLFPKFEVNRKANNPSHVQIHIFHKAEVYNAMGVWG